MAMALTARRRWVARHDRATGAEDGAEPDVSVRSAVQHTAAALPFASVAGHRIIQRRKPKAAQRGRARAPVMTLASAGGAAAPPVDAPRWRVVLGNLAAGATAGAAVEAGALKRMCTMRNRPSRQRLMDLLQHAVTDWVALQRCTPWTRSRRGCRPCRLGAGCAPSCSLAAARPCTQAWSATWRVSCLLRQYSWACTSPSRGPPAGACATTGSSLRRSPAAWRRALRRLSCASQQKS